MKILISSTGNSRSSAFDLRFGRANWFCIYNEDTGKTTFIENPHLEDGHGAGPKAAELAYDNGVEQIISGDFGPKAKDLLNKLNIQMIILDEDALTIDDIVKKLKKRHL
jgi:predicted Fe-Mo cluster-binding NifX family protein